MVLLGHFSEKSNGIVFGDGGASLVVEAYDHAMARKANVYAEYLGGAFSFEGWKVIYPDITSQIYMDTIKDALNVSKN